MDDERRDPHSLEERLDTAGHHYEHAFEAGNLRDSENAAANAGMAAANNDDDQNQAESKTYLNKFTGKPAPSEKRGLKGFLKGNKKKGPITAIIGLLIAFLMGTSFTAPAFLLVHVKETLIHNPNINMSIGSFGWRQKKLFEVSMNGDSAACEGKGNTCKRRTTISTRQENELKKRGVVLKTEDSSISGRRRVTGIEFKGETIKTNEFAARFEADAGLRDAFHGVNNPLAESTTSERALRTLRERFGITKTRTFDSSVRNDADRDKVLQEETRKRTGASADDPYIIENKDGKKTVKDRNGNVLENVSLEEAEAANADAKKGIGDLIKNGEENASKNKKSGSAALEEIAHGKRSRLGALSGVAITALPDAACMVYSASKAVSFGAKTIRASQMAYYSYQFLNIADQIKAGDATPEDVAYFANLLTKTVKTISTNEEGKKTTRTTKAATDSYGYKYAAYGDRGPLSLSATQFIAGGGLGGELAGYTAKITSLFGGPQNANTACRILRNKWVGAASIGLGIASIVGPGWMLKLSSEVAGAYVGNKLNEVATQLLPSLLQDLFAGVLIDDKTFGEAAGDAIVSGAGAMMSTLAGTGGNAPLRPEQAVAYMGEQNRMLARYAEEDRLSHSPLDASNPNTFMGRIATQFVPYASQKSSLTSYATTTASIVTKSFSNIFTPSALADSSVADFEQCEDVDYREFDIATDPFCNPMRGIPAEYLGTSPLTIVDYLVTNNYIDKDSGQPTTSDHGKEYTKFIETCINREAPFGSDIDPESNEDTGKSCFIEGSEAQKKAYFYLYHIDQGMLESMENGYPMGDDCDVPSSGATMSGDELKKQITSYGLPAPNTDRANDLLKHLKEDPNAVWAAQSLLDGEKKAKNKGIDVKQYLTTGWMWAENTADGHPDPYQVNCNDNRIGYASTAGFFCDVSNFQIAGYQAENRRGDYVEIFKKLYSENELTSVMKKVVENSSKTQSHWSYQDPVQKNALAQYGVNVDDLSSVTLNDLSPNKDFFDKKAQALTLILGKDPAMVAALNSFAVSDSDLIAAIKAAGPSGNMYGSSYYNPAFRQTLSDMMWALYMLDSGSGAVASTGVCVGSANERAGYASGEGISVVWGGKGERDLSYGLGVDVGLALYEYGIGMGLGGSGTKHTGVDVPDEPEAPVYSPVNGIVRCTGTGKGAGTGGSGCGAFNDVMGKGNGRIEIEIGNGDVLILGHTSTSLVKEGQSVKIGQQVGTVGGMNGYHTHVEVRTKTSDGWILVDPIKYLGGV